MKRFLNYIVIISLSLFVFGCDSALNRGKTIDKDSDEYRFIDSTSKGIVQYKGVPFNGNLTLTYANGQLWSKGTYKDGKEDGAFEIYYENGQLERKANYKDGKLNGDWKYYNEDGTIRD